MRRKDREVSDIEEKLRILGNSKVCRLGMAENNQPYVIPLNFGYEYQDDVLTLYFHGAREGKKIDILKQNSRVCFEVDGGHELIEGKEAWSYSFAYESLIGFGNAEFLENGEEKTHGLNLLMKHQTGKDTEYTFDERQLNAVAIFRVRAESFTGKRHTMPV
ncbi:5-nitroimidazole antibiotic resistance protein [Spirochaetia bacterium]|nr:5-nitroimidazole antibiotic resistance protein [Spirochaetia bacterium]